MLKGSDSQRPNIGTFLEIQPLLRYVNVLDHVGTFCFLLLRLSQFFDLMSLQRSMFNVLLFIIPCSYFQSGLCNLLLVFSSRSNLFMKHSTPHTTPVRFTPLYLCSLSIPLERSQIIPSSLIGQYLARHHIRPCSNNNRAI